MTQKEDSWGSKMKRNKAKLGPLFTVEHVKKAKNILSCLISLRLVSKQKNLSETGAP
jgi:hypothetical protein